MTAQIVGSHLEQLAHVVKVITYKELANATGYPTDFGTWDSHPFCEIFEQLDSEDALLKRPFRTALVVNNRNTGPGRGFFEALERHKGIQSTNQEARDKNWMRELTAAFAHTW